MNKDRRLSLLGTQTSRRNKLALIATYVAEGENVDWCWQGEPYNSRLLVSFGDEFQVCKSYDEDIRPLLKDNK